MEFKVTETAKGFIIEDKNGDTVEISFASIFKKAGRNADGTLPKTVLEGAELFICTDTAGQPVGVRVQALGENFVIGLHDAENGKSDFSYDSAMEWLKEHGKQTFNRKQAAIICIFIDEINDKLVEAGGEPFARDWYITNELYVPREKRSCADFSASNTWFFNGASGCFNLSYRYFGLFRCRPSLA